MSNYKMQWPTLKHRNRSDAFKKMSVYQRGTREDKGGGGD